MFVLNSSSVSSKTTGLSIIYGMFVFILGTFLSLDVYSGELGGTRTFHTVSGKK